MSAGHLLFVAGLPGRLDWPDFQRFLAHRAAGRRQEIVRGWKGSAMPEPLSQEVEDRIAALFAEAERAGAAQALSGYDVAPINFGRLRILEAAKGRAADLPRLVEMGNRYGQEWIMNYG